MAWAIGTGKWPQKSLTQWLFKKHIHQFPGHMTNTWHQSPLLHRPSFLLTQCPLLWILEVSSEVSLRLVVVLLLVSSLLEVFNQQWCSLTSSTKFLLRSLFALVSLFWVPVSTRSLVSFVMPKVHFWSPIFIFFFSNCVSQGGRSCCVNWFQEAKWVQWHTKEQGLMMALILLPLCS